MANRLRIPALLASLLLAFSFVAVDHADARRGGSFGSRGARTFQSAPATRTAPSFGPTERSMTPGRSGVSNQGIGTAGTTGMRRPGLFGGLAGGLLGGLALGGLFGMLMGTGFGGAGGFLSLLVQILLIGLGISFLMRFLRSRQTGASGNGRPYSMRNDLGDDFGRNARSASSQGGGFAIPSIGSGAYARGTPSGGTREPSDEIGVADGDLDIFEQRLRELQAAFAREDYGALRRITTPEVMSYLAEELSENATHGRKNDVEDVKLLQGDIAEAWREGDTDYASVAMRYSSIDVMRDRETGRVLEGDATEASETRELWTFLRRGDEPWKVSAIQDH